MLRFPDHKSYAFVQTGCYGTASYHWVAPSVELLKQTREPMLKYLQDKTELEDFLVWTANADIEVPGNRFALDLESGDVVSLPEVFAERRAVVLCLCKQWDLKYCTRSPGLGPLAGRESFFVRVP